MPYQEAVQKMPRSCSSAKAPAFTKTARVSPLSERQASTWKSCWSRSISNGKDVYITNVVKCRPPGNRDPQPEEISACKAYLDKQIDLVRPRLVVTLGRFSMQRYFPGASISRIHGQPKRVGNVIYYPMFHPAAALHQPRWRSLVEEDILKIPELLAKLDEIEEEEPELPQAQQLSLF